MRHLFVFFSCLWLAGTLAAPVTAGAADMQCRQNLASASTGIEAALAQVKGAPGNAAESCVVYRRHFLEAVKARAVAALCTTAAERAQDLGRFDNAVEHINNVIAERCGS
jgi:hypothetical protein